MKLKLSLALLFTAGSAAALTYGDIRREDPSPKKKDSSETVESARRQPLVQIAVLLDTSNSMDGLIAQAKSQLWRIVNEFNHARRDGAVPRLEVAVYEYGNDGLAIRSGYIRQVLPFTADLDKISTELFALKTNGGSEFCGQVIRDAVQELNWSQAPGDYKAIFIAGNEEFTQGKIRYQEACGKATERDIIVNTIHCGSEADGRAGQWNQGAELAFGDFLVINQDARVADVEAPQDQRILELNKELNSTYVSYGATGAGRKKMQDAQDANAQSLKEAPSSAPRRIASKASAQYKNESWDLVDAVKAGEIDLAKISESELPENLRGLDDEKRKEAVGEFSKKRQDVQAEIIKLSAEREKYVATQLKSTSKEKSLDEAMLATIRSQATKKAFTFVAE